MLIFVYFVDTRKSVVYPHFTHLPAGNPRSSHPRFTRWTPAKPATRSPAFYPLSATFVVPSVAPDLPPTLVCYPINKSGNLCKMGV